MSRACAFWKRWTTPCLVAKQGVEARRVEGWRMGVLWCSLALMAATRARLARAIVSVILVEDCTGSGGGLVACSGTSWDGSVIAEALAREAGEESGVRALFGLNGAV